MIYKMYLYSNLKGVDNIMIEKQLTMMKNFIDNEMNDMIERYAPTISFSSMAEKFLAKDITGLKNPLEEDIFMLLSIAQYIETDTTLESILTDEDYDKLHELYVNLTGHAITGTNNTSGSRPVKQHMYPELRGSLSKVHFIYEKDIPKNDSRKSLEGYLKTAIGKCESDGISMKGVVLGYCLKYDGVSGVFECDNLKINNVLTRKDTESNTGSDVSHIFNKETTIDVFEDRIPEAFYTCRTFGVKTEMLMKYDDFEEFKKIVSKPPKNHRSAASMIVNTLDAEYNPDWRRYLTIVPLQISCPEYLFQERDEWYCVGKYNDRYQYIKFIGFEEYKDIDMALDHAEHNWIDATKKLAEAQNMPIDGVVISFLDEKIAEDLGRSDHKNRYQIAFKFPAGIKKSVVEDVEFTVGPVSGSIVPVVKVKPINIMGNTITNISLSNIDKFERLDINVGDEVMVKYDIIPTLFKDETCTKGTGKKIDFPKCCPVCGEELTVTMNEDTGNRTVRCMNDECFSKITGKIYNYCNKMKIDGIGLSTIEDLVNLGVLNVIGDLYRLNRYKSEIISLPGYGESKFNNIMKSITKRMSVYPHEFLGSIGIPDIGRRVMKKICSQVDVMKLVNRDEATLDSIININGIGDKIALKLADGIEKYNNDIRDIMNYISLKPYEEDSGDKMKVLFSKVRDRDLEKILTEKYNAEIQSGYTKETNLLIVPDLNVTSSKIEKARKDGKIIMSIDDARKKYI